MTDKNLMDSLASNVAAPMHSSFVAGRRCQQLAKALSKLIGQEPCTGVDIGCGNGTVAKQIQVYVPNAQFKGVDVIVRSDALVEVIKYDGSTLPFEDNSFDFALIVDVLHHTQRPEVVLKEAARVSRKFVVVKDHLSENGFDNMVLSFMDWVGNRAHGISLPYNYQSRSDWSRIFEECGLKVEERIDSLALYPFPFTLLFDGSLHFAVRLAKL
ncbi:MAG: class I SAM-dependent methyltransferase [Candidatus Obscuribacterales bacterium]|nr:class I SAM-dependent methyltransferase [Candidatus Obscuribacterales bacterium]